MSGASPPLLHTKIAVPPLRPELVARPHLLARLRPSPDRKLTLVSAPAGSGKTTLLTAWAQQRLIPVAWLSLDSDDNDPARFWAYWMTAFRKLDPSLAPEPGPQPAATPVLLASLLNRIAARPFPVAMVLDDYHLVENPAIHQDLIYLLEHQPSTLHLIIATRADPPLPLARWRVRNQLCEVRAADLRFDPTEANAFFKESMRLDLSPEQIALLQQRTEGWAAGMQLAALSLRDRADATQFITAFSGDHHHVLEFLAKEVLQRQPESVQRFLILTSILDRLCGPLCEAVLAGEGNLPAGGAVEVLSTLQRRNLFIEPLDDEHHWYRTHRLFADLLRNRLLRLEPDVHRIELHRRAAAWYREQNDVESAVPHLMAAQEYETMASLVQDLADGILSQGRVLTLLRWLDALPEAWVLSSPRLTMLHGWALFLGGRLESAARLLQQARAGLPAEYVPPGLPLDRGRVSALLATIATLQNKLELAISQADEALALLPADDLLWRARALRALATGNGLGGDTERLVEFCYQALDLALQADSRFLAADILSQIGSSRFHQARLQEAAAVYHQILALDPDPTTFPPAGLGYFGLAELAYERNNLTAAAEHIDRAITLCRLGGIAHNLVVIYGTLALLHHALGDDDSAHDAMRQAEQSFRLAPSPFNALNIVWYQVRFLLARGEIEEAKRWVNGEYLAIGELPAVLDEAWQVSQARVFWASGDYGRVTKIHDHLAPMAQKAGRLTRVIEISLLAALAYQAQGELTIALQVFEKCLELAEPGRWIRPFIAAGPTVVPLLRQALAANSVSPSYVAQLLAALGVEPPELESGPAMVKVLTHREFEVLLLLCEGLSNAAIAERLFVTLSTVKKHAGNIYGKLGVTGRSQAILRARELGLLDSPTGKNRPD